MHAPAGTAQRSGRFASHRAIILPSGARWRVPSSPAVEQLMRPPISPRDVIRRSPVGSLRHTLASIRVLNADPVAVHRSDQIVARQTEGSDPHGTGSAGEPGSATAGGTPIPERGTTAESEERSPTSAAEAASAGAPPPAPVGGPAPVCQPKGLDRKDFLTSGGTTAEFGLTTLDTSLVTYPEVKTAPSGRGRVKLQPTSAALPTIPSIFTKAGSFVEGTVVVFGEPDRCPTAKYPMRWHITGDGARKIAMGEQEHCDDFQQAFTISIGAYASAVNKIAASGRTFGSEKQAERAVRKASGAEPADWPDIFRCLARLSVKARDGATKISPRSWHEPRPHTMPPRYPACEEARAIVSDASLPEIGLHPSADVIKGCGEAPAPTKKRKR
jgi:hypothetical protein